MYSNHRSIRATDWSQRALIVFIIVALIATFAAAVGFASHASGPDGTEAVPVNAVESLGIYVNNYETDAGAARGLARDAGAEWIRLAIDWKVVEPYDGAPYDWSSYDVILTDMNADGYDVIISLLNYPDWALSVDGHACGPVPMAYWNDFAAFAAAAVAHYYPQGVLYYELGNEPDNQDPDYGWVYGCWGSGPDQDADGDPTNAGGDKYAGFMAAAYTPMKTVASDIVVMMGGLAYDLWYDTSDGPFDPDFLDDFLTDPDGAGPLKGGGDYVDVINYHYFKAFAGLWGSIVGKGQYLQGQFANYSYLDMPLVVTEFGDPSDGPTTSTSYARSPNTASGFNSAPRVVAAGDYWSELSAKLATTSPDAVTYSEDEQANYVIVGFTRGMSYGIQPMLWFQAVDLPAQSGGYYYGLLESDLTPKPSYIAYDTLATELAGLTYSQLLSFPSDSAAEGYEFTSGIETRWVVWRNATISLPADFPVGTALRVVQKDGTEVPISDGGAGDLDGIINGSVRINIGPSPQILEPICTSLPPAITDVSVAISGGDDVELSWSPAAYAISYDIWRSDTAPYFEPVPGVDAPHDSDNASPYLDVDALTTPYPNEHFYLVTGRNVCEQSAGLSNRTGAFQFVLVPGS